MTTRTHEIRLIHIGKTALNLDDDAYRDLLFQITGLRSAANLNAQQRFKVLAHFKRIGFEVKPKDNPHLRKLRALWHQLADIGVVHDRSMEAFATWCQRQNSALSDMSKVTSAQAAPLIEALKRWYARELTQQAVDKARQ